MLSPLEDKETINEKLKEAEAAASRGGLLPATLTTLLPEGSQQQS